MLQISVFAEYRRGQFAQIFTLFAQANAHLSSRGRVFRSHKPTHEAQTLSTLRAASLIRYADSLESSDCGWRRIIFAIGAAMPYALEHRHKNAENFSLFLCNFLKIIWLCHFFFVSLYQGNQNNNIMKNIYYCVRVQGNLTSLMKCYSDCINIFTSRKDCINKAKELSLKTGIASPNGSIVFMYTSKIIAYGFNNIRTNQEERYFFNGKEVSRTEINKIIKKYQYID